jgi:hypothetical protein
MSHGRNNHESSERNLFSNGYPPVAGSYSYPPQGGYYPTQAAYPPQGGYYPPQQYPPSGYPNSGYHQPAYPASHGYPSAYPSGTLHHHNFLSVINISAYI